MKHLRSVLGIVLLLVSACARYFPSDLHLPRYATTEEIVGRWKLAAHTLGLAKHDGYTPPEDRPHEIIFHADGTCEFRSITEFSHKPDYLAAKGTWKLGHDTGAPSEKKKKNEVSIRIEDRGIHLYLAEEKSRLLLWDYWGDPDEETLLRYEKEANQTPEPTAPSGRGSS